MKRLFLMQFNNHYVELFFLIILFLNPFNELWAKQEAKQLNIITLSPNLTELAFAAGLGPQLVGVSQYSDYPEAAQNLPIIANANGINLEFILSLNSDIILAQTGVTSENTLRLLTQSGLTVHTISIHKAEDLLLAIEKFSVYSKMPSLAANHLAKLKSELAAIEEIGKQATKELTVFIELSTHPLLTTNDASLIHDLLAACHIRNIFAAETAPWPIVSLEGVIAQNPDLIFITDSSNQVLTPNQSFTELRQQTHTIGQSIPYQTYLPNARIMVLDPDIFTRETPRLIEAVHALCQHLHQS